MFRSLTALTLLLGASAVAQTPHLYRSPAINDTTIAFLYADDLWTVPREGGVAHRLTSSGNVSEGPYFSPDGRTLAYSASVQGNVDVYTIPVSGGTPKRLTYHPGSNMARGWSADGKDVLMVSMQDAVRTYYNLFKVHADGSGLPEMQPLPYALEASYSPDGSHLAYTPNFQWQERSWKRYRGGQTQPVWIVDTKTLVTTEVPRQNSNEHSPVWLGDTVYFLSDRNAPEKMTLYSYNTGTKAVKELVAPEGFDMKALNGHGNALVYEQFGSVHLFDVATGKQHEVRITTDGDLPALLPHLEKVPVSAIQSASISPTGMRIAVQAHGEIFTIPAEKGDTRDLTNTSNAAERSPAWSPDGQSIAYFSDETGEYKLYVRDQLGRKAPHVIDLGPNPTFYYEPSWSPDSKSLAYSDRRGTLWYVRLDGGAPVKVVTSDLGLSDIDSFSPSFSPDGKWIVYVRTLANRLTAAFVYNVATGVNTQITDGMSNVSSPVWDAGGKYLYFLASTDAGPSIDVFGLTAMNRVETSALYAAVLSKDDPSPVPPQSDDEKPKAADAGKAAGDAAENKSKLPEVKLDIAEIGERIVPLPVPPRDYKALYPGKSGTVFLAESVAAGNPSQGNGAYPSVWRFNLEKRTTEDVLHDVDGLETSFDGAKLLYNKHGQYAIAGTDELAPASADGMPGKLLQTSAMVAEVDPRAEWKQMFAETWRIEREFFYDPKMHGLDIAKIKARYAPFVDGLSARSDFTYLQQEMLGELTVGHMFVSAPPAQGAHVPATGLLGANYAVENDRYRITHIVHGANWSPALYTPLTQPGVQVKEGDYLLAVNGVPLHASQNIYQAFEGTAGQQVSITVGPTPDGAGARDVTVMPVQDDRAARSQEWVEGNIAMVDKLSGGKLAYVYVPDTGGPGFDSFNRYFFSQVNKQGVILDDRWNQGGEIADWMIDVLQRKPLLATTDRTGYMTVESTGAIYGPKAMLINQGAGSGGDAMPFLFRQAELGPLIGTRTWGGWVGIGTTPQLIDGGSIKAPNTELFSLNGKQEVENQGVPPDIEVQVDAKSAANGHDPQLERAVAEEMEKLKSYQPIDPKPPTPPNYHRNDGLGR